MKVGVHLMLTADGSHTVVNEALGKSYHSVHGALQESQRIYVEVGLLAAFEKFPNEDLYVFEMGFGTALNALLTAHEAELHKRQVHYTAIETDPLSAGDTQLLNYDKLLGTSYLTQLHASPWHRPIAINSHFVLTKLTGTVQNLRTDDRFHLIYYDAFAPTAQPELWEPEIFRQMAGLLLPGGMLTTYCSRSYVQRNMRAAGLTVEKHAGPRHKRNILRAVKY